MSTRWCTGQKTLWDDKDHVSCRENMVSNFLCVSTRSTPYAAGTQSFSVDDLTDNLLNDCLSAMRRLNWLFLLTSIETACTSPVRRIRVSTISILYRVVDNFFVDQNGHARFVAPAPTSDCYFCLPPAKHQALPVLVALVALSLSRAKWVLSSGSYRGERGRGVTLPPGFYIVAINEITTLAQQGGLPFVRYSPRWMTNPPGILFAIPLSF